MNRLMTALFVLALAPVPALASDLDAELLSERIQAYHLPYGVMGEIVFESPTSDVPIRIHDGDGAIWTGHYLASEAFRYAVTRSPVALEYARRALDTMEALCRISGTGRLARTMFPPDAPLINWDAKSPTWKLTQWNGQDMYYISYVTRDQYVGTFLGLGAVYDLIDDEGMRSRARDLITLLVENLLKSGWIMIDPDAGRWIETFVGRFDHMLGVLQLAKHVNPERFTKEYEKTRATWSWLVETPIALEKYGTEGKYYRWNLDHGYMYQLLRFEEPGKYRDNYLKAWKTLRGAIAWDPNAHWNMLEHAIFGPDPVRDQITRESLDGVLRRGFRDHYKDYHGQVPECGNDACDPIPVDQRVYGDFLWQRSPKQLEGGGDGSTEGMMIDYTLPYWMARYYGVL